MVDILVATLVALLVGALAGPAEAVLTLDRAKIIRFLLSKSSRGSKTAASPSYSDRIEELNRRLSETSVEMDNILREMGQVVRGRAAAADQLEQQVSTLSHQETQLKNRIALLENTPVEILEAFEEAMDKGEKRSASRDYLLFGAGVLVSAAVSIVLGLFGF